MDMVKSMMAYYDLPLSFCGEVLTVNSCIEFSLDLCRAYSPGTHARKDEDGLLLEFPCTPTRTRSV
jgi:hypothetical protein